MISRPQLRLALLAILVVGLGGLGYVITRRQKSSEVAASDEPAETADTPLRIALRLGSDVWPPFTDSAPRPRVAIDLVHTALKRSGVRAATGRTALRCPGEPGPDEALGNERRAKDRRWQRVGRRSDDLGYGR